MKITPTHIFFLCSLAVLLMTSSACKDPEPAPEAKERVVIMSFNILQGGLRLGQPLTQTVKLIQESDADIVGLQEVGDNAQKLADLLGWNLAEQGRSPAIVTRYDIVETYDGGVQLKLDSGQKIYVFNLHLAHAPYQPYQLLNIPYANAPFIKNEAEAIESARKARGRQVTEVLEQIQSLPEPGIPIFITGDFNEPSHLDWTERAAKAERHPVKVDYPNSLELAKAGFADAWRVAYPDEIAKPGYTWTPLTKADDPNDHHDRIDFVYFRGKNAMLEYAKVAGENIENADIVVTPYPSDHRAIVAEFALPIDHD